MLRVLVAEDSATARLLIVSLLSSDPDISVVGQAKNGEEAVALCAELKPDVVTMDIQMPVMGGLEATRQIVKSSATPVIMVSSLDPSDVSRSMLAFNAGALAVLAKPAGPGTPRFEKDCRELIATVKALSDSKPAAASPKRADTASEVRAFSPRPTGAPPVEIIGLVSSTGGPIALRTFFKAFPTKDAPPILIVQHIAAGFAGAFAEWLAAATHRTVKVPADQDRIMRDVIYVAPDDMHLVARDGVITLDIGDAVDGTRPSGTVLLTSLARAYGARAAGVLLTGTGTDGVTGLRELRDAGGAVYVQDEASCTTFETPGAAIRAHVVESATAIAQIPTRLANLAAGRAEMHLAH